MTGTSTNGPRPCSVDSAWGKLELDRRIGQTSGGEATLLGLAGLLLQRPDVLLLDEPTNNLDTRARARLSDIVDSFTGALLVVSHDRDLLRRMDQIGELRAGTLSWYGGNYDAYTAAVAAEQEAAEQAVRSAESDVRKQQRELIEARTKLDRRARYGKKMEANKREPKIIMGGMRKRSQQESTGKHRQLHEDRLADARAALADAEALVHDDDTIRIDLPGTAVPTDRVVLRLSGGTPAHRSGTRPGRARAGTDRGDRPERNRQVDPAANDHRSSAARGRHRADARAVAAAAATAGSARRRPQHHRQPGPAHPRPRTTTPAGPGWLGSCSAAGTPTSSSRRCPVGGNGSGPVSPRCCWPNRRRSCCCWTSRPTTSIWPAWSN